MNFIGVRKMEEWKKVTNLVTPGNLIRLGNVNYTTLAACLDLLVEYENGPANLKDDDSKVCCILKIEKITTKH